MKTPFWMLMAGLVLAAFLLHHVAVDVATRGDPPVACQLLGGSWSIWNGWSCG